MFGEKGMGAPGEKHHHHGDGGRKKKSMVTQIGFLCLSWQYTRHLQRGIWDALTFSQANRSEGLQEVPQACQAQMR
jgi:hypothetical protein